MINRPKALQAAASATFALLLAVLGSYFTSTGLKGWYDTLILPSFTPPGEVIGMVWTVLYLMLAVSIYVSWQATEKTFLKTIGRLYLVNGGLNVLWCYVFFSMHELVGAAVTAGLLVFSVLVVIAANIKTSKLAAVLLIPYLLWTGFATYLNIEIALLNQTDKITTPSVVETVPTIPEVPGTITLYVGVTKAIDRSATIKLERVDDSRCPADVQCIWAGELSPVFTVTVDGVETELRLGTMTTQKGGVKGYHFTLLDAGIDFAKVSVEK